MLEAVTETKTLFAWMDLETNGRMIHDEIGYAGIPLEVALIITDENFNVMRSYSSLVRTPLPSKQYRKRTDMPTVVYDMHMKSGLMADYQAATANMSLVKTMDFRLVDMAMSNIIYDVKQISKTLGDKEVVVKLAGSGVSHFDSRWIKEFFPLTWVELNGYDAETKPTLDIGVVRRFLQHFVPNFNMPELDVKGNHRAQQDVLSFIEEAIKVSSHIISLQQFADENVYQYEQWLDQNKELEGQ